MERIEDRASLMRQHRSAGMTLQQIGDLYGVSRQRVWQILRPVESREAASKRIREKMRENENSPHATP